MKTPPKPLESFKLTLKVSKIFLIFCTLYFFHFSLLASGNTAQTKHVIDSKAKSVLILIPAGNFRAGSTKEEIRAATRMAKKHHPSIQAKWFADELPTRVVYLPSFYIEKTEVTFAEYLWRNTNPPNISEQSKLGIINQYRWSLNGRLTSWKQPMTNITWFAADKFCGRRGRRLPTSDEWEKAARGTDGRIFPWGNTFKKNRLNSLESRLLSSVSVGSYPNGSSPYGVLDIAGNVWEWVADWKNPSTGEKASQKLIRGGGWGYNRAFSRTANMGAADPNERHPTVGFRCAKDL